MVKCFSCQSQSVVVFTSFPRNWYKYKFSCYVSHVAHSFRIILIVIFIASVARSAVGRAIQTRLKAEFEKRKLYGKKRGLF